MADAAPRAGRRRPPVAADAPSAEGTRDRVLQAAVGCIIDVGFHRASTNEIARRAGVSWGVIQHHFGSRERLLLAVLEASADEMVAHVEAALATGAVRGERLVDRLDALAEVVFAHFRRPEFLAATQVHLELAHDPDVGPGTAATVAELERRLSGGWGELIDAGFAGTAAAPEVRVAFFQSVRGLAIGLQVGDAFRAGRPRPSTTTSPDAAEAGRPSRSRRGVDPERTVLVEAFAALVAEPSP